MSLTVSSNSSSDNTSRDAQPAPRVFLPYYDPDNNIRGWQFGFPGRTKMSSEVDVAIVDTATRNIYYAYPRIYSENDNGMLHGHPEWAWAFITGPDGTTRNVHIEAPVQSPGVMALADAQQKSSRTLGNQLQLYTPAGLSFYGLDKAQIDVPFDIPTGMLSRWAMNAPADAAGQNAVRQTFVGVADVQFAMVRFTDEQVLSIIPCRPALYMKLWTSHLHQIVITAAVDGNADLCEVSDGELTADMKSMLDQR